MNDSLDDILDKLWKDAWSKLGAYDFDGTGVDTLTKDQAKEAIERIISDQVAKAREDELNLSHLKDFRAVLRWAYDHGLLKGEYPDADSSDKGFLLDQGEKRLTQLIRTEKLKLLAEVREQTTIFKIKAHDEKGQPHLYEAWRGVPPEVLDKLEAEL